MMLKDRQVQLIFLVPLEWLLRPLFPALLLRTRSWTSLLVLSANWRGALADDRIWTTRSTATSGSAASNAWNCCFVSNRHSAFAWLIP
jgi:hypothetical protein